MKGYLRNTLLILAFLVCTAIFFVPAREAKAVTSGSCGDGVYYTLDDEGLLTISGSGAMTSHPWSSSTVKKVEIQGGVTSITAEAFYYCFNLTNVEIPSGVVSIGNFAFKDCSNLTSVEIPDGVTNIGSYAFSGCSRLTSVKIPGSVSNAGYYTFSDCSGLKTAGPTGSGCNYEFGWTTSIPERAFSYCDNLTSIEIPEGVISIGKYAFSGCSKLNNLKIPGSVASIGDWAFSGCSSLKTAGVTGSGCDYEFGWTTSIPERAFYSCSGLTSIKIPASITSIGCYALFGCNGLKTAGPAGSGCDYEFGWKKNIPDFAFYNLTGLTSIEIPSSVTSIGNSAFYNCSRISSLEIPDNVTSIGSYAFFGCKALTSIKIPSGVASIVYFTFYNCSSLNSIEVPNSIKSIGYNSFYNVTATVYYEKGFDSSLMMQYGGTLTWLPGVIEMNVQINVDDRINLACLTTSEFIPEGSETKIHVTRNGSVTEVAGAYDAGTGIWTFDYGGIPAKCMTDDIQIELYIGDKRVKTFYTSVVGYCETLYSMSSADLGLSEKKHGALKIFIANMLEYGAACQKYASYNLGTLANANRDIAASAKSYEMSESSIVINTESNDSSCKIKSANLEIKDRIRIVLKVYAEDASGVAVDIDDGENQETKYLDDLTDVSISRQADGYYVINLDWLSPADFDTIYTISIKKEGEVKHSLDYGVYTYLWRKKDAGTDVDKNLIAAIYNYGKSAKEYIEYDELKMQ